MKLHHYVFDSLRTKIMLLVLLSLSPSCILIYYASQHERSGLRSTAFHDAFTLAQNLSDQQEQLIDDARRTLFSVSQVIESIVPERIDSQKILSEFQKQNPHLISLFIAKPDGEVIASSMYFPKRFTIADRPIYHIVTQQKAFAIGEYQMARIAGKPILSMAYPILGDKGQIKTIYITGLDLTRLDPFISKSDIPRGTVLTIIDRNGTLLYQYPNAPDRIGKKTGNLRSTREIVNRQEGTLEIVDEDGIERLYGFSTFGRPKGSVFIAVAIPKKAAFAGLNKVVYHQIIWFGLVLFLALSAAWMVSSHAIIKPLNNIVHAAQLIAGGNLTYRIDDKGGQGEIHSLSRSFNQMAEALRQRLEERGKAEEKFRTIFDRASDGMLIADAVTKKFLQGNTAICSMLGYTKEEIESLTLYDIERPQDISHALDEFEKLAKGEKVLAEDQPILRKDGSIFYADIGASPVIIGGVPCLVGIFRDITERKRAEEELRLSEERFRRIFDEGPFGMILSNPDYTIVMANKAFCGLLGYSEQEIIGQTFIDLTCEEDREKNGVFSGQLFAGSIPMFRLEKRYVRKDGGIVWTNLTVSAIHGKEGNVLYSLAIIEDLTESRKAAEKIHLLHYYDSLTSLPNRTFFKELMQRSIEHAKRHKEIFGLIYIGLDNFQRINDTLGHSSGDLLLKAVADRLTNSLRRSDYVASSYESETTNVVSRVGGDEFIVLASDLNQAQDAATASQRLLKEISDPYDLNGQEVFMTASIGISLYPGDGTNVDDLLKNADTALEHAKKEGKNNYQFYSGSMNSSVLELLIMESDLHKALERNELVLYYQPKVDAATRMVRGMEALIRWKHPDKGLISPQQFIPLAETSGLIIPIGEFVIRTACRQIKAWQEAGYKQMNVALNVSGRQFDQQSLIEIVKEALQNAMIPPQCLELEITESIIMRNPEKAIRILTELKALGIEIAIDDFGTGYSSLSYLKRLPLDFLKIDMSFVKGLASDPSDQAIVRATIAMAHSLNLKTIAEGVETKEQLSFLQEHGCDEIQGYLFSRPLPAGEIPGILAKGCL